MAILPILKFIVSIGVPAFVTWWMNRGKKPDQPYKLPQGAKQEGDTITFPDGTTVNKIQMSDIEKQFDKAAPELLEALKVSLQEPQKFPELSEITKQAREMIGDEDFRKLVPELKELPKTPEMPPADQLKELDFGPIAERARKGFMEETLPGISEQFTGLTGGGQRASAFERQKAQAGATLESNLAALRAQVEPEYALKRAEYGLQRGKLAGVLGQLGLQRGQVENAQQMQRAQILGNLGLAQQRNVLGAAQLGLGHAQMSLQPQQNRQRLIASILQGGVNAPYDTAIQGPQQTWWQTALPYAGDAAGEALKIGIKQGLKYLHS